MRDPHEFSELAVLRQVEDRKAALDGRRPLDPEVVGRVWQKLRLEWNYHSNAIEGNSLNYGETYAFLMHGVTARGKPLKDYLDVRGHNQGIDLVVDMSRDERDWTEADIRNLHKTILVEPYETSARTADGLPTRKTVALGRYKTQPNHVETETGEIHYYVPPDQTPMRMESLMSWYRAERGAGNPIVVAALFHHEFAAIHPFDDGNGRLARLLMNLVLLQRGYPPAIVRFDDRGAYYAALAQADAGDHAPFVEFIANRALASLDLYLAAADGKPIDEPDDLDKDIALLRRELAKAPERLETSLSADSLAYITESGLADLFAAIRRRVDKLSEFFLDPMEVYTLDNTVGGDWIYQPDDVLGDLRNFLDPEPSSYVFCIGLDRFRWESDPFGVEVKLELRLEEFVYTLRASIGERHDVAGLRVDECELFFPHELVRNKYHEAVSEDEIAARADAVTKDVMTYIRRRHRGDNPDAVALSGADIEAAWNAVAKARFPTLPDTAEAFIDGRTLTVMLTAPLRGLRRPAARALTEYLRRHCGLAGHVAIRLVEVPSDDPGF